PFLARLKDGVDAALVKFRRLSDWLGIVLPQPAQRVRKDSAAVLRVVSFGTDDERALVAGELERGEDVLVADEPVSGVDVVVSATVLHEAAQRLGLVFAYERGEGFSAAQVGEAADESQYTTKGIGPVPRCVECSDAAGAGAADAVVVRIFREIVV